MVCGENLHVLLRKRVEMTAGFSIATPKDFIKLEREIYAITRCLVSSSTLKRYWGYLGEKYHVTPARSTLNILCDYIGYISWDNFVNSQTVECDVSNRINNPVLNARALHHGDVLRVVWSPNHSIVIRFDGLDMFTVLNSQGSKLSEGAVFCCSCFVSGEPLYLTNLLQRGEPAVNYICGKDGGITYTLLKRDNEL